MSEIDLTTLSAEQLQELSRTAKELARKKADDKVDTAVKAINEIAAEAGLSVRVFVPSARKKNSLPVKYRDPDNPKNTFKGMGVQPKWLQEKLAQGHTLEDFLV